MSSYALAFPLARGLSHGLGGPRDRLGGASNPPVLLPAPTIWWISGTGDATPIVQITFPDITSAGTIVHYEFADNELFASSTIIDHTITEGEEGSLQISPEMEPLANGDWWLRIWYTIDGQNSALSNVETKTIDASALPVVTHRGVNTDDGTIGNNNFDVDLGDAAADRVVLIATSHQGNGTAWSNVRATSAVANGVSLVRVAEAPDFDGTGYAAWYMGVVSADSGVLHIAVTWPGGATYLSKMARVFTVTGLSDTSAPQEIGGFHTLGNGFIDAGGGEIAVIENDLLLITGCVYTNGMDPAYTGATEAPDVPYISIDSGFKLFAARWSIDGTDADFSVGTINGVGAAMVTLR